VTISLVTRGIICHKSSKTLSLLTWGFLCSDIELDAEIGFGIESSPPDCTFVYNKDFPQVLDPRNVGLFATPVVQLTGQRSPLLGSKRPSLADPRKPGLFNPKIVQLTGSKVVTLVGTKSLLLSEPEEPTLTSSGTRAPDIFDKDC
jgi:hypothetical protein